MTLSSGSSSISIGLSASFVVLCQFVVTFTCGTFSARYSRASAYPFGLWGLSLLLDINSFESSPKIGGLFMVHGDQYLSVFPLSFSISPHHRLLSIYLQVFLCFWWSLGLSEVETFLARILCTVFFLFALIRYVFFFPFFKGLFLLAPKLTF